MTEYPWALPVRHEKPCYGGRVGEVEPGANRQRNPQRVSWEGGQGPCRVCVAGVQPTKTVVTA
jgi:hypothetical protein